VRGGAIRLKRCGRLRDPRALFGVLGILMPEITSAIIKLLSPMPTELPTASQFMRAGAPVRWIVAHYITRES